MTNKFRKRELKQSRSEGGIYERMQRLKRTWREEEEGEVVRRGEGSRRDKRMRK